MRSISPISEFTPRSLEPAMVRSSSLSTDRALLLGALQAPHPATPGLVGGLCRGAPGFESALHVTTSQETLMRTAETRGMALVTQASGVSARFMPIPERWHCR
jgi:hypothetical protein